jgi:hypothetical protein
MGRTFVSWSGVWVAAGLALQPARAGDHKNAAADYAGVVTHHFNVAAQIRSGLHAELPHMLRFGVTSRQGEGANEFSFVAVSPFESRLARSGDKASMSDAGQKEKGASPRPERKSITLFRFDSKLGSVSVQPVVGGVNGAQLSVGF